ncbi:AmmeMemoRadiSam system protein B [candidate division KSB1 bacterium]|nr:AmmeMemoRadiSam system protein B [candidate division KSB1 bacterium]
MKPHSRPVEPPPVEAIRKAAVAGKFYPSSPQALRRTVAELLAQAHLAHSPSNLFALISPHAGYMYSGGVAAHAYKLLHARAPRIVAVIAPSHFERFPFISIFGGRAYATPLGEVPIAQSLVAKLLQSDDLFLSSWHGHCDSGNRAEHAVEVQLPFLQTALPDCKLLPIVMGEQSWALCETLGRNLALLAAEHSMLIIASSDLSHYHSAEEALQLDQLCMDLLLARDPKRLFAALEQRDCEACGAGPIVATMLAAEQLHANHIDILCHSHSGVVSGDMNYVVGYLAASISRKLE